MFYYTYVLKSKIDNKLYVGFTDDLRSRLLEHNGGKVKSTQSRKPLILLFYEAFSNKKDAVLREKFLKTGWGRIHLKKALKYALGGF